MRLGRRANAFLFSEHGKPYLKALVKYHVALNETLYSDAFYSGKKGHHDGNEMEAGFGFGYEHVDLTTLLHDLPLSVDIRRWHGWVTILVNGFTRVLIRDGVAADGVIHVIDQVLVPPCKHGGNGENLKSGEVSVEELKARLEPYVEDETRLSGAAMMDTCTQEALYMKKAGQKYVAAIGDL
jgi:Secreted and surface protein containing fasciclin-like repeats